mmetsp:Transcript_17188/g.51626  ORF Transcript_17188/g.51626 Transcript_17188/m.51626 type:complete len:348 (-) Transcript_17188:447-1490(-)
MLHGHRKALHDLGSSGTDHVHADQLVRVSINDDLHEVAERVAADSVAHRPVAGGVDIDVLVPFHCCLLAESHRAQLWVGEDGGRDGLVAWLGRLVQHDGLCQRHALHQSNGCQLHAAGDIAHCPDGRHIGARVLVHNDYSLLALVDAGGLQAQLLCVWGTAGRHHHGVVVGDLKGRVVLALDDNRQLAVVLFLHLHGRALGVQVQAGCLVLLREELAAIAVKAAQRQRLAVHCVRLAAKAVEDARELHADVAAADDGDLLWRVRQLQRFVTRDAELRSWDANLGGAAAHCNHDVFGTIHLPVDIHLVGANHLAGTLNELHLRVLKRVLVSVVQAEQLLALGVHEVCP